MWEVLKTAQEVAEKSLLVRIDEQALINFAAKLSAEKIAAPSWNTFYHFYGGKKKRSHICWSSIALIFVFGLLSATQSGKSNTNQKNCPATSRSPPR